jgi:Lysine methyltransferase
MAAVFCPQAVVMGDPCDEDSSTGSSSSSSSSSYSSCVHSSPPTTINNDVAAQHLLMLEGDVMAVSLDGIARTCYHLTTTTTNTGTGSAITDFKRPTPSLAIEEQYDLRRARKTFLIREMMDESGSTTDVAPMGRLLGSVDIQEMDQRCHGPITTAGDDQTGGTTWEASIAMALYFCSTATAQHEASSLSLSGRIIELGCGVGLGGILTTQILGPLIQQQQQTTENSDDSCTRSSTITSVTLTDGNEQVLDECRRNVQAALHAAATSSSSWGQQQGVQNNKTKIPPAVLLVKHLDWNNIPDADTHMYNVVLASDVAYMYADVEPLGNALEKLLVHNGHGGGQIHLFAPYNRGALPQLCAHLREALNLHVVLEWVDMVRYRLNPQLCSRSSSNYSKRSQSNSVFSSSSSSDPQWWRDYPEIIKTDDDAVLCAAAVEDDRSYASKSTVKFLHITATRKEKNTSNSSSSNQNEHESSSLEDID